MRPTGRNHYHFCFLLYSLSSIRWNITEIFYWKKKFKQKCIFQFSKSIFSSLFPFFLRFFQFFWFCNYSWRSTLYPEKVFMRIVYNGFKNRQKVVFVSLKKHKKMIIFVAIDFLKKFSLDLSFSPEDTYFSENLACTRLFFTKID